MVRFRSIHCCVKCEEYFAKEEAQRGRDLEGMQRDAENEAYDYGF